MKKLILIGAGSFGRELFHWAKQHSEYGKAWTISGFIDDDHGALEGYDYPVPIIGSISDHIPVSDNQYLCAIAHPATRERICQRLVTQGAEFSTFIHPSVIIGGNVKLGIGSVICPACVLTCDIEIGGFNLLNCGVTLGHDVKTGGFCTINGNAELTGGVQLGERVFIGSHATTHPGAQIQNDAKVGLGSAAIGRIKSSQTVLGVPARPI